MFRALPRVLCIFMNIFAISGLRFAYFLLKKNNIFIYLARQSYKLLEVLAYCPIARSFGLLLESFTYFLIGLRLST